MGKELVTIHNLFKQACYLSTSHCHSSHLSPFIQYMKTGKENIRQRKKNDYDIPEEDINCINDLFSKPNIIISMKTSKKSLEIFLVHKKVISPIKYINLFSLFLYSRSRRSDTVSEIKLKGKYLHKCLCRLSIQSIYTLWTYSTNLPFERRKHFPIENKTINK